MSKSRSSPPPSAGKEARRYERLSCSGAIEVLPCKPKGDWKFTTAELVNCSKHGIAMRFAEQMLPNEQFLVKLKINSMQLLVFQVRWCMGKAPHYVIGAEFAGFSTAQFNEADADAMLQAFLKLYSTEGPH